MSSPILIKNIYYMLSYAFRVLRQNNYKRVAEEEFDNAQDLFAEILYIGISQILKQGLHREYVPIAENLSVLRGKLNVTETIKNYTRNDRQKLFCEHDEFSENNIYNQILKSAIELLLKNSHVKSERKAKLRKVSPYFSSIDPIDPSSIKWSTLRFQRNNKTYMLLISICYFVISSSMISSRAGKHKVASLTDEQMEKVYEKFILEYYKQEHPKLKAEASRIDWVLDKDFENPIIDFLPKMQSDITLRYKNHTLIIDAKYYTNMMQKNYDKYTLHSGNLYQIFTYVKNEAMASTNNISGMLLYAKAENDEIPSADFSVGGSRISARTLDLNTDFTEIRAQLDAIAEEYLYNG